MNPLVSIVIACYNDKDYVKNCLLSIQQQTYAAIEVIVVDDGSAAPTKELLASLQSLYTVLITQENKGQAAARNAGITAAKGDYILIVDSDDSIAPTYVEKAVATISTNENVQLVCSHLLVTEGDKQYEEVIQGGVFKDFLFKNPAVNGSMFRKSAWSQAGGYDVSMRRGYEDWEFFIRLMALGGICKVIPEPLYHYLKRPGSTTTFAQQRQPELWNYIFNKNIELYKPYSAELVAFYTKELEKRNKIIDDLKNSNSYKMGNKIATFVNKIKGS